MNNPLPKSQGALGHTIMTAVGGALMGIANLIPGLSGGTMILAVGLYTEFIDSVAEVSAMRFSRRRIVFLSILILAAGASIVGLAGVILFLLFRYSSAMYALFIGLTLGGAPILARSLKPIRIDVVVFVALGIGLMAGIMMLRQEGGLGHGTVMDFTSGIVGSTTMVLPGISGSYMLLVMDQYDRIVGSIDDFKLALQSQDWALATRALKIAVPVGIGVVIGIVGLSNLLKVLLHRHERPTIAFLLGMLFGSVLGLWPFGRAPDDDAMQRRSETELVAFAERNGIDVADTETKEATIEQIIENWDARSADAYSPMEVVTAVVMILAGFATTISIARFRQTAEPTNIATADAQVAEDAI